MERERIMNERGEVKERARGSEKKSKRMKGVEIVRTHQRERDEG